MFKNGTKVGTMIRMLRKRRDNTREGLEGEVVDQIKARPEQEQVA